MDEASPERPATPDAVDATRRTYLASERTELAWWRTGFTALAVALAVGQIVPGLEPSATRWPFEAIGVYFAIYGVAVIGYGSSRRGAVERALAAGRFPEPPRLAHAALAGGGVVLGVLTILLVAFG